VSSVNALVVRAEQRTLARSHAKRIRQFDRAQIERADAREF